MTVSRALAAAWLVALVASPQPQADPVAAVGGTQEFGRHAGNCCVPAEVLRAPNRELRDVGEEGVRR